MSLPNKLIGCEEEIRGLAAPLTEGMKGLQEQAAGGGVNMIYQH